MEKKITPEQADKVKEGMDLWRGKDEPVKPESKTKTGAEEFFYEVYDLYISRLHKRESPEQLFRESVQAYSDQQLAAFKEKCLKILEDHLNSINPETGDDYRCGVANSINLLCDL